MKDISKPISSREMRDMFVNKKSIHIKLKPDLHARLRTELFNYNLTMQDIFNGFCQLLVDGDKKAKKIVQKLSQKKLEDELNKETRNLKNEKKFYLSELEEEAVYNLIKDSSININNNQTGEEDDDDDD